MSDANRARYLEILEGRLSSHRFRHTLGVEKMAAELAARFGADAAQASTAALLHDYAKPFPDQALLELAAAYGIPVDAVTAGSPALLHGPVAAKLVQQELGILDADILAAIETHTIGAENMSKLQKIIYLADLIEENRDFGGINIIREAAARSLDLAMLLALEQTVRYTMAQRLAVHPASILAYNALLNTGKGESQ